MKATVDASPLRLKAGQGFETRSVRSDVGGFIIVEASLSPGSRAPVHVHERAYLATVLRGRIDEEYGARAVTLREGTVNFLPAATPHLCHSPGARAIRIEVPERVMALADAVGPVLQGPAVFTQPAAVALARRVAAELRSRDHGWRLVVHGLAMELLGQVVRDQSFASRRGIPRWLRVVKERLDSDWHCRASLGELARSAGVHPIHLARAFRASYGSSIGEYRRGRQLKAAEERLLQSNDDLCDVAVSCGFVDQSHFSKAFRRAFGVSPGRYRRAARE